MQAKFIPSKEFSFEHAMEMAENMLHLARVLAPMQQEQDRLKRKLKDFPEGFHLEGKGYSCFICYSSCSQEETWYDQNGIKCMTCQGAVDRGEIPATAADKETWYSRYDMENCFGVNRHVVKRWVKEGILKVRSVKRNNYEHVQLLLIEDNKEVLPPKELVKSQSVNEMQSDGSVLSHMEPWYRFVDPFTHLKGYKIMDYLHLENGQLAPKPVEK
jgi:ribosomal protein S26